METFLLFIAILLAVTGLLGSFLPILPGPPLAFLGLAVLKLSELRAPSNETLGLYLLAAGAITVLDYYIPAWGTQKSGGSPAGVRGATAGLVLGLFAGPLGILFGPLIGAFLAELINGSPSNKAFKSALGAFLGFIMGFFIKAAYAVIIFIEIFTGI